MVQLQPLPFMATRKDDRLYIEDNTHHKRGHNIPSVISFTAEIEFSDKKEKFLSRNAHKKGLIWMVSDELRKINCTVVDTTDDADVDIRNRGCSGGISSTHT